MNLEYIEEKLRRLKLTVALLEEYIHTPNSYVGEYLFLSSSDEHGKLTLKDEDENLITSSDAWSDVKYIYLNKNALNDVTLRHPLKLASLGVSSKIKISYSDLDEATFIINDAASSGDNEYKLNVTAVSTEGSHTIPPGQINVTLENNPNAAADGGGGGGGANQNIVAGDGLSGGGNEDTVNLAVTTPYSPEEKSKLATVQQGAQKNIPRLQKFAATDNDTRTGVINNGTFGLKIGNNIYQANNNIDDVTTIDLPFEAANFGEDPGNPNTDVNSIDTQTFFDLFLTNGVLVDEPIFLKLDNKEDNKTAYVKSSSITKDTTNKKYILTNLKWENGFQASSAGEHYDITAYMNRRVLLGDVAGLKEALLAYVQRENLIPKDTRFISNWSSDMLNLVTGNNDARYGIAVTSDSSGSPTDANAYEWLRLVPNNTIVTVVLSTTQWKNTDFNSSKTIAETDIAGKIYLSFADKPKNHIKINVTSGSFGTLGSGNSEVIYFQGTTTITGTIEHDPEGTIFIEDEAPSTFWEGIEIPWDVIVGDPSIQEYRQNLPTSIEKTDGDLTTAIKILLKTFDELTIGELVEWHDEHHTGIQTLTGYSFKTTSVIGSDPAGKISTLGNVLNIRPLNNTDKTSLKKKLTVGKLVRLWVSKTQHKEMKLNGVWSDINGVIATNIKDVSDVGTALADNDSVSIQIESNIPARDEIKKSAFVGYHNEIDFTDWQPILENLQGAGAITRHWIEYTVLEDGNSKYVILRGSWTGSITSGNFSALSFDLPPVPGTGSTPSRITCFVTSIDSNFKYGQCGITSNKVRVVIAKNNNDGNSVSFSIEIHYKTN